MKTANLMGKSHGGANFLIIAAAFLSEFSDDTIYIFMYRRDVLAKSGALDVIFHETGRSDWDGIRLTGRGKKILRDLPFHYLGTTTRAELDTYKQGRENENGHPLERLMCARHNGQVLPAADDQNCRDIKIKIGRNWLIAQCKLFDGDGVKGVVANYHK